MDFILSYAKIYLKKGDKKRIQVLYKSFSFKYVMECIHHLSAGKLRCGGTVLRDQRILLNSISPLHGVFLINA